jgi:hypothetical protein
MAVPISRVLLRIVLFHESGSGGGTTDTRMSEAHDYREVAGDGPLHESRGIMGTKRTSTRILRTALRNSWAVALSSVLAIGTVSIGSQSAGASSFDAIVTMTPLAPYGRLGISFTPGTPVVLGENAPLGGPSVSTPTVSGLVILETNEPLDGIGWRNPLDKYTKSSGPGNSFRFLLDTTLLPNGLNMIELNPGLGFQPRWFRVDNPSSKQLELTSPSGVRAAHDAAWRADETLTFSSGETFAL